MPLLDVFKTDVFGVVSLTEAVDMLPYQPSFLGQLGLFVDKPISTTTAMVENREGTLSILNTATRGNRSAATTRHRPTRKARAFIVPHIPHYSELLADSLQNVRAFGQETQVETFSQVLNDELAAMRQDFEATFEWHRIGALKGDVLDADGSTLYNWFTEFGISETSVDFDFQDAGTYDQAAPAEDMKDKCVYITRLMQYALGGTPFTGITAICGNTFFDRFVKHATVRKAYEIATGFARTQQGGPLETAGFEYGGILWKNYTGYIGSTTFLDDDEARFFPTGTTNVFQRILAPADYIETVNTIGRDIYAKQQVMDFDKGIDIEMQSNPLFICTRPSVLIKGVNATPSGS